jgi:hypothetical protein
LQATGVGGQAAAFLQDVALLFSIVLDKKSFENGYIL